ncbi:MAG TPA: hypothetical protein VGQ59_05245 [Cyclobacteriaceae bacterium]|jgi:hypothetical protein|nr:hypothetical protein [Cyclobacteriaceae bacterium]
MLKFANHSLDALIARAYPSFVIITLFLIALPCCKPKEQTETSVEQTDSVAKQPQEANKLPKTSSFFVQYNGASNDEIKRILETFSPLTEIQSLASRAIRIKDSIYSKNTGSEKATLPAKDSVLFNQQENKAYKAIVAYQQMMLRGPSIKDACPSLMQLTRNAAPGDSSVGFLPQAGRSQFFAHGNFFFLGGAPFIGKLQPTEDATFTDPDGKPETRFVTDLTENGNYFLNSIYHFKNLPSEITFGPPLNSYSGWSREIRGIGSLIHRFINRVPVYFLTEQGVVSASLSSVTIKLVPEDLGCVSDQPIIEFACSKSIEAKEILGVYIPYTSSDPTTFTVTRNDNRVWTADLNGDGIDDLACVSGSYEGIGDIIAESLWFVNIDGQWKIIDSGQNLDCT